jgi:predicted NBD/HSP70 family sugar kinase
LAADIGGTNLRAGLVELNGMKKPDWSAAKVSRLEFWRHADEAPTRDDAVERLVEFLRDLIQRAEKEGRTLAPFIGIGCPGVIQPDGSIERGGQNLPGNWEHKDFNLPQVVREAIPRIGEHETVVIMHNDAVVQGLSELPWMQDVEHWGVMTIGTGLGNARFTNKEKQTAG